MNQYVIGLDFGTDSVRALVVDTATGEELASDVAQYRRWAKGMYCDPARNQFRQHPLDYIEGMVACVRGALDDLPDAVRQNVVGLGIDTTGSTPCAVDATGTPLALFDSLSDNPNAMFILWKDHTALQEAAEINELAKSWGGEDFTKYEGGVYSAEWFWAKILHVLRTDAAVGKQAYSWVEHCDWMPALLTGTANPLETKRSRCTAGHKGMWHESWGGLPPEEFLVQLDPLLGGLRRRLFAETYTSDHKVGGLTAEWAERLGLGPGVAVAVGALDAHMGAVGGGVSENTLVKIMGTSTCDIMVVPEPVLGDALVAGICGQVDGSVLPGMVGLEAGQSAFGDVYAWFKDLLTWPTRVVGPEEGLSPKMADEIEANILIELSRQAAKLPVVDGGVLALDWLNGRRTPFADQGLKGALLGLRLGTDAPMLFKALVEATAFGSRAIVERFRQEGIRIDQVIALGGIAGKNQFVMQTVSDVLNMPIKVVRSQQSCALGATMFAAVAAGCHPEVVAAQDAMGSGFSQTYVPDSTRAATYQKLFQKYMAGGQLLEDFLRRL